MNHLPLPPEIRPNKIIIFKGKKYPVDFHMIKQYSHFFYENQDQYRNLKEIELSDEKMKITDDDFQNFIFCCQNQSFQLSESNIFSMYQLSLKYDVPSLLKITKEYVDKNRPNFIFDFLEFKYQNQLDFNEEENILSMNLDQYINDEKLLSLPIPALYRILNNKNLKMDQNEIIEFLFKCLNKFGREASVLFSNFDFKNKRIDLYSRLMSNYSNVFDFNMINPKFLLNTTNELLSELQKLKIEFSNSISEMKKLIEDQKNRFNDQNDEIKNIQNSQKLQFGEQIEMIKKLQNTHNDQIKEQIEAMKKMQNSQNDQIKKKIENFNQTENDLKNIINKHLERSDAKLNQCEKNLSNLISQNDEKLKLYITKDVFIH